MQDKADEQGWETLTREEQRVLRMPSVILWGIYESAYFANERGVLGDPEWERFYVAICRARTMAADMWDPEGFTPMVELLTPAFLAYIKSTCE